MKGKTINAFIFKASYIGPEDGEKTHPKPQYEFKTVADDLHTFYRIIDCDTIDIVVRKVGDRVYNIVCDDEGLLKENPMISMISPNDKSCAIVGNVILTGPADDDGNLTSITQEDAEYIAKHIRFVFGHEVKENGKKHTKLMPVILIDWDN